MSLAQFRGSVWRSRKKFLIEGARVALFDINDEKGKAVEAALSKNNKEAKYFHCDVSKVSEIDAAVNLVAKTFGTVNILVNNAGILHSTKVEDITEEEWDRMMAINLKSVFFMSQKVLPFFKQNGKGKIVNTSSLAGRMGGYANGLGYSATKAGIIGLTYGLARRVAGLKVNVNAVAPGTTETEIFEKHLHLKKFRNLKRICPYQTTGQTRRYCQSGCILGVFQSRLYHRSRDRYQRRDVHRLRNFAKLIGER